MKRVSILSVLFFLSVIFTASAQVMDMRAFSRQRGFKAYQPQAAQTTQSVSRRTTAVAARENTPAQDREQSAEIPVSQTKDGRPSAPAQKQTDQTEEMKRYIATNPHVKPDI